MCHGFFIFLNYYNTNKWTVVALALLNLTLTLLFAAIVKFPYDVTPEPAAKVKAFAPLKFAITVSNESLSTVNPKFEIRFAAVSVVKVFVFAFAHEAYSANHTLAPITPSAAV